MDYFILDEKLKAALWAAHSLFERGKASGSSANLSFRHGQQIYISRSGSCFGTMEKQDHRHFFRHLMHAFMTVTDFC